MDKGRASIRRGANLGKLCGTVAVAGAMLVAAPAATALADTSSNDPVNAIGKNLSAFVNQVGKIAQGNVDNLGRIGQGNVDNLGRIGQGNVDNLGRILGGLFGSFQTNGGTSP